MKGTFDNEIKNAIAGNKSNVNSGNNAFGKAKGGKKFGKQKPVAKQASSAAGGKGETPGVRVPSEAEEIAEGEMPVGKRPTMKRGPMMV